MVVLYSAYAATTNIAIGDSLVIDSAASNIAMADVGVVFGIVGNNFSFG